MKFPWKVHLRGLPKDLKTTALVCVGAFHSRAVDPLIPEPWIPEEHPGGGSRRRIPDNGSTSRIILSGLRPAHRVRAEGPHTRCGPKARTPGAGRRPAHRPQATTIARTVTNQKQFVYPRAHKFSTTCQTNAFTEVLLALESSASR